MNISRIGFIGLGLIAGSIAKAIRQYHPDAYLLAYDPCEASLDLALEEGTLDAKTNAIDAHFCGLDLIILGAPVDANNAYLSQLAGLVSTDTIISDVGSVKRPILSLVENTPLLATHFVGGHPMTGSEKSGYPASKAILLENAYYVLTPTAEVAAEKVELLRDFITSLKALPIVMEAKLHDRVVAGISHLPHLIAASLVNFVKEQDDNMSASAWHRTLAAGGFLDITRIASSSPKLWQEICDMNQEEIKRSLDGYIKHLQSVRRLLDPQDEDCHLVSSKQPTTHHPCNVSTTGDDFESIFTHHLIDSDGLLDFFTTAREYRSSIPGRHSGGIAKSYLLYLDLADEAGGIARIATHLAEADISIKNIGILHNREFQDGVLGIEFYGQGPLDEAKALLTALHYPLYEHDAQA